ncbi:RES family NAD+ phosphorylase [Pseudomonas sp. W2-17]|uniref:RES family NAD+ phosphorylase n=1 Tax=Pseudomonas sp. W2-17 TaxID=3058039 RepID=UPI0034E0BD16
MQAWRISKANAANDLSGTGAAQFGGRWNHADQPAVYLALSASGCALDTLVQCASLPQPGFQLVHLQLPDDPALYWQPALAQLPPGWEVTPADRPSMDFGSAWLERREQLGLIVPSAIITHTRNLLLNPRHPAMAQVRVLDVRPFACG